MKVFVLQSRSHSMTSNKFHFTLNYLTNKIYVKKRYVENTGNITWMYFDWLIDLVNQMAGTYNLPLKVAYSTSRGFHIQLYGGGNEGYSAENLPEIFIKVTKFKNALTFTTADLVFMKWPVILIVSALT